MKILAPDDQLNFMLSWLHKNYKRNYWNDDFFMFCFSWYI